jgi:hypothetical protein
MTNPFTRVSGEIILSAAGMLLGWAVTTGIYIGEFRALQNDQAADRQRIQKLEDRVDQQGNWICAVIADKSICEEGRKK